VRPEIHFSVATVWSDDQIAEWASLGTPARAVTSVYGCRREQLVGHGRAPDDVPAVDARAIEHHARVARQHGMRFLYLFNGRCEHLDFSCPATRRTILADVEWAVEAVRADCLVVADLRLAQIIRSVYSSSKVGLKVSTIAGIKEPSGLEPWLQFEVEGVVLHHDVARNFPLLAQMVRHLRTRAPEVSLELLVNESCPPGCAFRSAHYARLARAQSGYVEGFQQNCNLAKLAQPWLILAAPWVRPEDIEQYCELGVRHFKIAGREMPREWLHVAVRAYVEGRHRGNLIDLLTMTPPGLDVPAAAIIFLNNSALSHFLNEVRTSKGKLADLYRRWARMLWAAGAFRILDPDGCYELVGDVIRCVRAGQRVKRLLELRTDSDPVFPWASPQGGPRGVDVFACAAELG